MSSAWSASYQSVFMFLWRMPNSWLQRWVSVRAARYPTSRCGKHPEYPQRVSLYLSSSPSIYPSIIYGAQGTKKPPQVSRYLRGLKSPRLCRQSLCYASGFSSSTPALTLSSSSSLSVDSTTDLGTGTVSTFSSTASYRLFLFCG